MIKNLYIILDTRAEAVVGPVLIEENPVPILRALEEAMVGEKNNFNQHPEDFVLLELGKIDTETGTIDAQKPEDVITLATIYDNLAKRMRARANAQSTEPKEL